MEGVIPLRLISITLLKIVAAWANLSSLPLVMSVVTNSCSSSVMANSNPLNRVVSMRVISWISFASSSLRDLRVTSWLCAAVNSELLLEFLELLLVAV